MYHTLIYCCLLTTATISQRLDFLNVLNVIDEDPMIVPRIPQLNNTEYDFIIVGSGSAGSVIANRLSEINDWKILLLEAGYPENLITRYPILAPVFQVTDYNWDYLMEPQDNICLAMVNQQCGLPRGKALGGTTIINYMVYSRGHHHDYDLWASMGNPGWSYKDILPYFKKSENVRLKKYNEDYHGKGGLLSVEDPYGSEIVTTFLEASQELGHKLVDYNSADSFGFSKLQGTIKMGRRHNVARAFLKPAMHRKNLHILTGARVTKILIDPSTKEAYGVQYHRKRQTFTVRAKKEVIISAGAFISPQLLMLSGIGPKDHLREVGIEPLQDLPVGQTLYDHVGFVGFVFDTNVTLEPLSNLIDPVRFSRWYTTGVGPLASLGGAEAVGYIKTNVSTEEGNYPDIEIILGGGSFHSDYGLINRRGKKITDEYYNKFFAPMHGTPGFTIDAMLLHPKSKGHIKLRSSNPYDNPLFYGNYLTDPEEHDLRTLLEGIRYAMKLVETEAFKKYNARLNDKPFVGCEHFTFNSDDYWKCAIKYLTTSFNHQTATCKMGSPTDPTTVVSPELKVHGIKNLRVADTSAIPITISGHMNAPTIMLGEKASDLIKKDWGAL